MCCSSQSRVDASRRLRTLSISTASTASTFFDGSVVHAAGHVAGHTWQEQHIRVEVAEAKKGADGINGTRPDRHAYTAIIPNHQTKRPGHVRVTRKEGLFYILTPPPFPSKMWKKRQTRAGCKERRISRDQKINYKVIFYK